MHTHRHVRAAANPLRGFPKERRGRRGRGQAEMEEKRRREPWIKAQGCVSAIQVAVRQPRLLTNRPRSSALSFLVSANPSAAYHCLPDPGRQNKKKRGGGGLGGGKLMSHNCHDSGRGARQLFYIPGMYSMQISTKARHSFAIVDPEGNQISLWQPW